MTPEPIHKRAAGTLLHITSLPSKYGVGDLGPGAYRFVDFLAAAKHTCWQTLPVNPTSPALSHCPYSPLSAFAANTLLISPDLLHRQGLLTPADLRNKPAFAPNSLDYPRLAACKSRLFDIAFDRFRHARPDNQYRSFCRHNSRWLDDYALFAALREKMQHAHFTTWPRQLRDRHRNALTDARDTLRDRINREKFLQYTFFKQWADLKAYAAEHNIALIGDIPMYVAADSADTWTDPHLFKLTRARNPRVVAGVPPDFFSKTGQIWPSPIYDWRAIRKDAWRWPIRRLKHNLQLFDLLRLDHFRAFADYWQIPASEKTAVNGRWIKGPGRDLFDAIKKKIPDMPFFAEDLGDSTDSASQLADELAIPRMKVLLFAFGPDFPNSPHLPHNYTQNTVVYTSTHDNNTARGWFRTETRPKTRKNLSDYLARKIDPAQMHWELLRLAMASPARLAIVPMQDILGLDRSARMNTPGTTARNWLWRLSPNLATKPLARKLATLAETYART